MYLSLSSRVLTHILFSDPCKATDWVTDYHYQPIWVSSRHSTLWIKMYSRIPHLHHPFQWTTSPNRPTESHQIYSNGILPPLAGPLLYLDLDHYLPAPQSLETSMEDHPPVFVQARHDWPWMIELQRLFHSLSPGAWTWVCICGFCGKLPRKIACRVNTWHNWMAVRLCPESPLHNLTPLCATMIDLLAILIGLLTSLSIL